MYISGGRNNSGAFFNDVWALSVVCDKGDGEEPLLWTERVELRLPEGRCEHSAAITVATSMSTDAKGKSIS